MYIKRRKEKSVLEQINRKGPDREVLLVEGARQVGKTTLLNHVLEKVQEPVLSLDLEKSPLLRARIDDCGDFSEFEDLLLDELGFDPTKQGILFIDEAQESFRLGGFVRYMKESWPASTVILSGSTLTRIFRDKTRYPVGRVERIVVRPFSFSEFLEALGKTTLAREILEVEKEISPARHQGLLKLLDRYLEIGGLPRVVVGFSTGEDFWTRRAAILADYEQDFIRLFGESALAMAKGCMRSVANYVGSPSKNTTVVPAPTNRINEEVRRIFGRLENWRLILRSDQKGPSPEASHRYLPKRYLFDTGVLRHMREGALPSISILHTLSPENRKPLGGIVENQVAVELVDQVGELYGWKRTPSGSEIDFVAERHGIPCPIECKPAVAIKKTHLRGMREFMNRYDVTLGITVSLAPDQLIPLEGRRRIINLPLYRAELIRELLDRHLP